jgi:ubiquitin thioesterase protein OTUB1
MQVPVRVVYLDRSGAEVFGSSGSQDALEVNTHDFIPDACAGMTTEPIVHVLYRPGHYDILYKRPAQY